MRTKPVSLLLLASVILTLLGSLILNAQNAPVAGAESIVLPGSDVKTEDAVNRSDAIFVGVITEMGVNVEGTMNYMHDGELWDHMKVNVIKVFRGAVGKQISVTTHCSGIDHVKKIPLRGSRKLALGTQYLFFVKESAEKDEPIRLVEEDGRWGPIDPLETIKLLPATDDNITKVKALIAATPPSNL